MGINQKQKKIKNRSKKGRGYKPIKKVAKYLTN
jgi:hypothetical protein